MCIRDSTRSPPTNPTPAYPHSNRHRSSSTPTIAAAQNPDNRTAAPNARRQCAPVPTTPTNRTTSGSRTASGHSHVTNTSRSSTGPLRRAAWATWSTRTTTSTDTPSNDIPRTTAPVQPSRSHTSAGSVTRTP